MSNVHWMTYIEADAHNFGKETDVHNPGISCS